MKRFSIPAVAIAMMVAMSFTANAQIKNVLLEQHTGTWCGWCPDGTVKMDEILALYRDQAIGVKLHTGDAMQIAEESAISTVLGLSGVPTGSVNRRSIGGAVFLDRGAWKAACASETGQRAKAEVDCFYTLDKATRTVRIQVMANIVEAMSFPLRFNAFIIEDDVTGAGSGYDQKNFLSSRPGYEGNPYYSQPSVLVGYHHMKVVRKMLGGAWGVAGSLPTSVKAGEFYSHTFETTINASWNIDKVHFVGMLQADAPDSKEIINSAIAIQDGALLNRIIDSDAPAAKALPAGSDVVNTYTLENRTTKQQTYKVTLSTTKRTPANWSARFTSGATQLSASGVQATTGQMVVPASSTAQLSLTLKVGPTLGLGDAQVVFDLQGTPTIKRSRIVSAITPGIEHLLLETGSEYSMRPYLTGTVCADAVTLNPGDYLAFANALPNVKLMIWNKGPSGNLSVEEIRVLKNAGTTRMFICGDSVIYDLASSGNLSYFGLEYIGWNVEGSTLWFSGQAGDVITGALGGNIQGRVIGYLIDMVKISDPLKVFPILHFQNNGLRTTGNSLYPISAKDAIVGVRSTRNSNRTVLLGMSPYVIVQETIRQQLVRNVLAWLAESGESGGGPAQGIESFETGDFRSYPWEHAGDMPWSVSSAKPHGGNHSAQAGAIGDNERSRLALTLDCVAGEIRFHVKVSSEANCDYLVFEMDGQRIGEWSGEQDWTEVTRFVGVGIHTFAWEYGKDSGFSQGDDTAWLDDIIFPGR
jgi:hypothetical protein